MWKIKNFDLFKTKSTMRKVVALLLLLTTLTAVADERGEARLARISRYYASLGDYRLSFVLKIEGAEQSGELGVQGQNFYMRLADTEVFVADSVRYEVRPTTKEIVVDKSEHYEQELLSTLNGLVNVGAEYDVVECEVEGRQALRMTSKRGGDTIYIVLSVDGESISRLIYGSGEGAMSLTLTRAQKSVAPLPKFDKERYKGFELVDFR